MLTLAICDDNKADLDSIVELIKKWTVMQTGEEINIKPFISPYALLEAVSHGRTFDIFLLDILMPEMTGISLGERLQNLCEDPLLIYLTSSEDYYSDAFRLYAFQYICKPIHKTNLFQVMDKALFFCEKRKRNTFAIKTIDGIVQIPLYTIVYIELSAHICCFHMSDSTILQSRYVRTGFDKFIAPLMLHRCFVKTHMAFVINLNFAGKLAPKNMTLTTGAIIPVTRTFATEVQQRYMEHALQSEGDFS